MADKSLYIKPPPVVRAFDWTRHNPVTRSEIDAFFASDELLAVKRQIVDIGRRLYQREYVDGNGGNLSVRVAQDLVLCSPTLCSKGFMEVDDICLVDLEAGQLCGRRPATSEVRVHIAMMKATGFGACIHAHPPCCNAFLFAGQVPPNGVNPEADIFLGQIPLAPYGTPGTPEVADAVAKAARQSNVVFMENHGVVAAAADIEAAEWYLENADAYCKMLLLAGLHRQPVNQVPEPMLEAFLRIRRANGLQVPEGQGPYNTREFAGYRMGVAGQQLKVEG